MNNSTAPIINKYLVQLLAIVFISGGLYITLESVTAMAEDNKEKIEEQEKRDDKVDQKLERIDTTQGHILNELEKQDDKLDIILEELRKE